MSQHQSDAQAAKQERQEQNQFDVIVVGSGAGAMTSAIIAADQGLSVLVLEKTAQYGGTSAISGGGIWIPNNHHYQRVAARKGLVPDSLEQAAQYMRAAAADGNVSRERIDAYLNTAPEMIAYLEQNTPLRYAVAEHYPDYYPKMAGALDGGRTLDPELFDTTVLGEEAKRQRAASPSTLLMGKVAWTARDAHQAIAKSRGWQWTLLKRFVRYKLDFRQRKQGKRDRYAGLGGSLIAALRKAMMDRDIPLYYNTDFTDLIIADQRVIGVKANTDQGEQHYYAKHGVVLASGGFEQSQRLREKYLPQPTKTQWSATPAKANTGAALEAGIKQGAATRLLNWCWWSPTMMVPKEDKARGLFAERAFPGAIIVNQQGQRFYNEAAPYLEFGDAMYQNQRKTQGQSIPAYAVFDAKFRFHYAMGPLMPAQIMPDGRLPQTWRGEVYYKADTIAELAALIGVDPDGLQQSVEKNNQYAQSGQDLDFNRGGNVYDRYYGDPSVKPNPCLAPIAKGPFYAMPVYAGDIGTKGGLLTDEHAQVVRNDHSAIAGLYAIGNCSASVMGTRYPGAGSTLGPAMTFGYIAARHIAKQAMNSAKRNVTELPNAAQKRVS